MPGLYFCMYYSERTVRAPPSTPGTDITHKSVLNITPSVKIEHNIVSNIGARNAGFVFLYENYSDIMKSL
jgi:hypothetical protein